MYKILSSKASFDSAMKFRDALEEILGLKPKSILVSKDSGNCREDKVILRYGCGYGEANPEPEWNSPLFINTLCINKGIFSDVLHSFIDVPIFHNSPMAEDFPVMIRETLVGKGSEGIHVVHNTEEFRAVWKDGFWWTKFYTAEFELRVMLVLFEKGYQMRIYKKVPVNSDKTTDEDFIVEGENTFWQLRDPQYYPKVVEIVKKVLPIIWGFGGRFVGIDMIYVPEKKNYVTLEFNSGPWLTKLAAKWLANLFVKYQWNSYKE